MGSSYIPPSDRLRLERDVEHVIQCGGAYPARIVVQLLLDVGDKIGGLPAISAVLAEYQRLTPAMAKAAGADRPIRRPLHVVPR